VNTQHFRLKYPNVTSVLWMEGLVGPAQTVTGPSPLKKYYSVWDTGATNCAINNQVVSELNLQPISQTMVGTGNGVIAAPVYLICFRIPGKIHFNSLRATLLNLHHPVQVLIGMDVIGLGDFYVTNHGGFTDMHFSCPSGGVDHHHSEVKKCRESDTKPPPTDPALPPKA
jgi:hypothetical protein